MSESPELKNDIDKDLRRSQLGDASERTPVNLAHKAALIVDAFPDRIPNVRELEDMTRAFGFDLVSMALLKILSGLSPNRYFMERVDRSYRDLQLSRGLDTLKPAAERAELCIVQSVGPGASWGAHVETWRAWGRKCGVTTEVIQTDKRSGLLANAERIRKELLSQPHDRRIIATLGQGSAEFRLLLEQLLKTAPHELHGLKMWMNVAGLVHGASGFSHLRKSFGGRKLSELQHWAQGRPSSIGRQLEALNPRLRCPLDLRGLPFVCVSMVGFPSVVDVPVGMKGSFLQLAEKGPNDGFATFHETVLQPGYVVPVPGMSHRAEPDRLGPWFQAVLRAFEGDVTSRPNHSIDQ